jgi:hypothetical protein
MFFPGADLGSVGQRFSIFIDLPEMGMVLVEVRVAHKGEDGKGTGLHFEVIDEEDTKKLDYFLDIFQGQ